MNINNGTSCSLSLPLSHFSICAINRNVFVLKENIYKQSENRTFNLLFLGERSNTTNTTQTSKNHFHDWLMLTIRLLFSLFALCCFYFPFDTFLSWINLFRLGLASLCSTYQMCQTSDVSALNVPSFIPFQLHIVKWIELMCTITQSIMHGKSVLRPSFSLFHYGKFYGIRFNC